LIGAALLGFWLAGQAAFSDSGGAAAPADPPPSYVVFFPERRDRPGSDSMDTLRRFKADMRAHPGHEPVICYAPSADNEADARRARWLRGQLRRAGAEPVVVESADCLGVGPFTPPDSHTLIGFALQLSPPQDSADAY
jgi:hypothetical protein